MRIERTIREKHPQLKQAQFCGVVQMAHEAREASFANRVRETFPPTMLRLNDALNIAYALFVDNLYRGATAYADSYARLPSYQEGKQLFALWQRLDAETPEGEEWRMVDAFAERLGLIGWYAWKEDPEASTA